jgi:ABC-type transporter Mla MlaB component
MVLGQPVGRLVDAARELLDNGRTISVDLSGIVQIDAHGLGALAMVAAACLRARCRPTLVGASRRVRWLLRLACLLGFFDCVDERQPHAPSLPHWPAGDPDGRSSDLRRCS